MLWVTFGYAEAAGMSSMVGANVKDENYFAEPRGLAAAARVTGADRRPNWKNGAPGEPIK